MKRPMGLSNPWGKTRGLLHPLAPTGEKVCAWGGCRLWGKVGSRSIAALSWRHPGREGPGDQGWRPGHWRPAESAGLMGALDHLFCSGFQWCWAGDSVPSETRLGRDTHTSVYLLWMDFQVQICQRLMFKKQCVRQIQVSPLSSSSSGEPAGTSYLPEGQ